MDGIIQSAKKAKLAMGGYQMKIERILMEDQMAPIGLDEKKPAFSWLLTAEEGEQNLMQSACRIVVRTGEDTVWDSGNRRINRDWL